MKKIVTFLFAFAMSLPLWCGETGLFTYEGGFFIKDGNIWKEYRPKDKPGIWNTYSQYGEEANYYNIRNNTITLAIPKTSNNNFYKRENGDWRIIYTTRVIYSYFKDSSVGLFCFETGYYVRDKKKWRLYLPDKKEGLWTDFDQYDEDDKFFYLKMTLLKSVYLNVQTSIVFFGIKITRNGKPIIPSQRYMTRYRKPQ